MAEQSKIEWTDATWNPVRGCEQISPGCKFCYAKMLAKRNPKVLGTWGPDGERVVGSEDHWKLPVRWAKKHLRAVERGDVETRSFRIFTVSLGDIFEDHPIVEQVRDRIWRETLPALEALRLPDGSPAAVLLLLTKRPEVMARWAEERGWSDVFWAGCTVEDQRRADERIPHLLRVPAPVRFLSCEPLLGPVDLTMVRDQPGILDGEGAEYVDALRGYTYWANGDHGVFVGAIHWLIIGGESGAHARPMHPDWARSLIRQGVAASITARVAVHFKQFGEWRPSSIEEWAEDDGSNQHILIAPDGRTDDSLGGALVTPKGTAWMRRVGKKTAGRVIDGLTWDGVPHV